jgi:hypothetical protein
MARLCSLEFESYDWGHHENGLLFSAKPTLAISSIYPSVRITGSRLTVGLFAYNPAAENTREDVGPSRAPDTSEARKRISPKRTAEVGFCPH